MPIVSEHIIKDDPYNYYTLLIPYFEWKNISLKKTSWAVKTYMTFTNVYWFRVIFELIVTSLVWRFWRTVDFGFKDAKESSNGSPVGGRSKFSKPDHNFGQRSSEMPRSICVH